MSRPSPPAGAKPGLLKDPCNDRAVSKVALPPAELLTPSIFWSKKGVPDVELLQEHLAGEGLLSQELLLDIIKKAGTLFESEPNLVKLSDPMTVVGDIHGQFFDLLKLLEVGGKPGDAQYLFLGDYVDRGSYSVEVVTLLYVLKIKFPKRIRMLRGNHECRQMTSFFNFREECEYKYDITVYNAFMDSFDTFPLAATINNKFLAVHGGLSPELLSLKTINSISRVAEPPREGLLCDLLWSDPLEEKDQAKAKKGPHFVHNKVRGCSYSYSFEGTIKFLTKNSLLSVIRAHEVQIDGYKMHKTNQATGFPSVITIFSAPNYCDVYNNKGAILKFDNSTLNILQYNCSPHPYHLPNFMDVFSWSMPFLVEKVTEVLYHVLQPAGKEEDELPPLPPHVKSLCRVSLSESQNKAVELASMLSQSSLVSTHVSDAQDEVDPRERLRRKVASVGRMARMFKTLRQENETMIQLKGVCPGHRLPPGLLVGGKERMLTELDNFSRVVDVDHENEMRPGSFDIDTEIGERYFSFEETGDNSVEPAAVGGEPVVSITRGS